MRLRSRAPAYGERRRSSYLGPEELTYVEEIRVEQPSGTGRSKELTGSSII